LNAKLRAWVGKYLNTFAKFPLHKAETPSSLGTLVAQSKIPVYFLADPDSIFVFTSYV